MPSDPVMSECPKDPPHGWLVAALARFERPLVRYALSLCGDLEQARDAVQETFVKLSRQGRPAPDDLEKLAPWLFTVCRHRVIDLHRKARRYVAMDAEAFSRQPCQHPQPDCSLQGRETASRLRSLIEELPEKQRQVIRLKFEAGLSYREIAAATGLSCGNIGWLIHQAVQSLRQQWAAENP